MRFKELMRKGITSYCVILSDTGLDSFQQLQGNHDLDKQYFDRFLQLRNHFDSNIKMPKEGDLDLIDFLIDGYKKVKSIRKWSLEYTYACNFTKKFQHHMSNVTGRGKQIQLWQRTIG